MSDAIAIAGILIFGGALLLVTAAFFYLTKHQAIGAVPWYSQVLLAPVLLLAFAGLAAKPVWGRWIGAVQVTLWCYVLCATTYLIASSNYVLNEILDASFDRLHPLRRLRPAAAGTVRIPIAWAEWILLMAAGMALSWTVSVSFTIVMAGLWAMGIVYNVPPLRTKDVAYLDVLTEAVTNPLRLLAGWYITRTAVVPSTTLCASYWMVGCYFMAIKRYAELREFDTHASASAYRKSFLHYDERRLLISIVFYAAQSMLFFGAFTVRYRLELILAFPLIAFVMAAYLWFAFERDSPVQHPELLWKEPGIVIPVVVCSIVMVALLFIDVPVLYRLFQPSVPAVQHVGR